MFKSAFEFTSPLSPDELAALVRTKYFDGQAECASLFSPYNGRVDEAGFKIFTRGRCAVTARGTFEPGSDTRVKIIVDPHIKEMLIGIPFFLVGAFGVIAWVFWGDWQRFQTMIVALAAMILGIFTLTTFVFVLAALARRRYVKSQLAKLLRSDEPAPGGNLDNA